MIKKIEKAAEVAERERVAKETKAKSQMGRRPG